MKYTNLIQYHKILENLDTNNFKNKKKITIYNLYNFNPLVLNKYLQYFLKQKGIKSEILPSEFDQIDQELMSPNFNFKYSKSNILIIGSDINLKLSFNESKINFYLKNLKNNLNQCLRKNNNSKNLQIIFWNCATLKSNFFSTKDKFHLSSKKINNFNEYLYKLSKKYKNLQVLDINKISNLVGIENFYDQKNYYISKIPYSEQSHNYITFELSQIINSIFIPSKKCLVLDLDNTLWGGILSEDGAEGIDLGTTYIGEKYKNFQRYIKLLLKRGVILAICSKNDIKEVKESFKQNSKMVLKFEDFSSVKINWDLKYININKIAKELNIGKDSIVFFDDLDFEREQMKKFNPSVNVIEVPKDPEYFIQAIENSGFFHQYTLTNEDKRKKYQYKILKKAHDFKFSMKNIDEFLINLSMKLEISNINKFNFDRSVQLTKKTNQFNLTTKRYNNSELELFLKSNDQISLVARLKDKFGDHGITALAMAKRKNKKIWTIDTFLLSCRILGRKVENILLYELLKKLKQKKANFIEGIYIKTNKNQQCKDFFVNNSFIKKNNHYLFNLSNLKKVKNNFFKVKYE
jgi:FkbH-like protein